jgi:hypothetical protein
MIDVTHVERCIQRHDAVRALPKRFIRDQPLSLDLG